jgi:dimethylaniline monooxygenase (N-oxide forming)
MGMKIFTECTLDSCMSFSSHHSEPDTPETPGMDSYKGQIMHSHAYREAGPFVGQMVLVIGAGPSALDIALEVSKASEKV